MEKIPDGGQSTIDNDRSPLWHTAMPPPACLAASVDICTNYGADLYHAKWKDNNFLRMRMGCDYNNIQFSQSRKNDSVRLDICFNLWIIELSRYLTRILL